MDWDLKQFLWDEVTVEEPKVRRVNLFNKLCRLEQEHGLPVTRIIARTWHECTTTCKRSTPSRMFCRIVKLRLMEARLWDEKDEFGIMTLEEIMATGVFKRRAPMPLFEGQEKPPPRPGHHPACQRPACKGCQ